MNRYLCKCGRAVNKSTNADNTGNRETEGCEGCPYLMPPGPTEWDHTRHAMVTDVKGMNAACRQLWNTVRNYAAILTIKRPSESQARTLIFLNV